MQGKWLSTPPPFCFLQCGVYLYVSTYLFIHNMIHSKKSSMKTFSLTATTCPCTVIVLTGEFAILASGVVGRGGGNAIKPTLIKQLFRHIKLGCFYHFGCFGTTICGKSSFIIGLNMRTNSLFKYWGKNQKGSPPDPAF